MGSIGNPDCSEASSSIIDLHDLGVLLNYERASTDPRFRHIKLRDVATIWDFKDIFCLLDEWYIADRFHRLGLVYDRPKNKQVRYRQRHQADPDLPTNMLTSPVPPALQKASVQELEAIYWRTRSHDGGFKTVNLLQHFFKLLPPSTRIRVRTVPPVLSSSKELVRRGSQLSVDDDHEPPKPTDYLMPASDLKIMEFDIAQPTEFTLAAVLPNEIYMTGGLPTTEHCVVGLASDSSATQVDTVLDLSSMQFGNAGRGDEGDGLFVLEPVQDFVENRLPKFARYNTFVEAEIKDSVKPTPDDEYLAVVAKRVKTRWEDRGKVPFCAYCGAPPQKGKEMTECTVCKVDHYCTQEHQQSAGSFHKYFCRPPGPIAQQA